MSIDILPELPFKATLKIIFKGHRWDTFLCVNVSTKKKNYFVFLLIVYFVRRDFRGHGPLQLERHDQKIFNERPQFNIRFMVTFE